MPGRNMPGDTPIRYFALLNWLQEELIAMPSAQLPGAVHVLEILSEYMEHMYFEEHVDSGQHSCPRCAHQAPLGAYFDRQAMVKTITECFEAGAERLAAEETVDVVIA